MTYHSRSFSANRFSESTGIPVPVIIGIVVFIKTACILCCCARHCYKSYNKNRSCNRSPVVQPKVPDEILSQDHSLQTPVNQNYSSNLGPPNYTSDYSIVFGNPSQASNPASTSGYPLQPIALYPPYPTDPIAYPASYTFNTIQKTTDINSKTDSYFPTNGDVPKTESTFLTNVDVNPKAESTFLTNVDVNPKTESTFLTNVDINPKPEKKILTNVDVNLISENTFLTNVEVNSKPESKFPTNIDENQITTEAHINSGEVLTTSVNPNNNPKCFIDPNLSNPVINSQPTDYTLSGNVVNPTCTVDMDNVIQSLDKNKTNPGLHTYH